MAKVDLGEKQVCPECEKKFYDLTKRPAICPYCAHSFEPGVAEKPLASNVDEKPEDENTEAEAEKDEEDLDADELAAKELELDGDSASFGSDEGEGDDENAGKAPDMDGFQTSDDDDDAPSTDDEENNDAQPPTHKEGEEPEEVEI